MKRVLIGLIVIIIVAAAAWFIAPEMPFVRQYQLDYFMQNCGNNLSKEAKESYLYRMSNLDDMNGRKVIALNFQLQTKALFNPKDTREFCSKIVDEYITFTTPLHPVIYGNLQKAPITFRINGYEKFGPVYELQNGLFIDHYDSVVTAILASDKSIGKKDKEELERQRLIDWRKKQAPIAWHYIQFGDSEKRFESKAIAEPAIEKNRWSGDNAVYELTINGHQYKLQPMFHDDELYLLNIGSKGYPAAEYSAALKEDWQTAVSFFTKQFGNSDGTFIQREKLAADEISWTHQWKILSKIVNVGLSLHNEQYYVIVWIGDNNRMQRIR